LVFVGDAMEENVDRLCQLAGELGLSGVPIFLFHEGGTRSSRGPSSKWRGCRAVLSPFRSGQRDRLRDLLGAVAVYAAGDTAR